MVWIFFGINFDSLVRIEPFQGLARTPWGHFYSSPDSPGCAAQRPNLQRAARQPGRRRPLGWRRRSEGGALLFTDHIHKTPARPVAPACVEAPLWRGRRQISHAYLVKPRRSTASSDRKKAAYHRFRKMERKNVEILDCADSLLNP